MLKKTFLKKLVKKIFFKKIVQKKLIKKNVLKKTYTYLNDGRRLKPAHMYFFELIRNDLVFEQVVITDRTALSSTNSSCFRGDSSSSKQHYYVRT